MKAGEGGEEPYELLAEHPHPPRGLRVKLDKGFEPGVYCIWIEYDLLAEKIGFAAARRKAVAYADRLCEQMGRMAGYSLDGIEDFSHSGDPRRKRDLEQTFLSFALTSNDGLWHDAALKRQFQIAPLRADQEWDQHQARWEARRRGQAARDVPGTLGYGAGGRILPAPGQRDEGRLLVEVTARGLPAQGTGHLASES